MTGSVPELPFDTTGSPVEKLSTAKGSALAHYLHTSPPFARLLSTHLLQGEQPMFAPPGEHDLLVVELHLQCPQRPVADIRPTERVGVIFCDSEQMYPEVLVLRGDFPTVPHLNDRPISWPASLCLYDRPYEEVRLSWTPPGFIDCIRDWFRLTAEGRLHAEDQPLEPLLLHTTQPLIAPAAVFSRGWSNGPTTLRIYRYNDCLRLSCPSEDSDGDKADFVCMIALECQAQQHGIIRHTPETVGDLQKFLGQAGLDLITVLRTAFSSYYPEPERHDDPVLLLCALPKTRNAAGPVESIEHRAFYLDTTVAELGKQVGAWQRSPEGELGRLLPPYACDEWKAVRTSVLNPMPTLTSRQARLLSGIPDLTSSSAILAIGVGAIGSQVLMNLVRSGYGRWTVVDDDVLLPHNLARHSLPGLALGVSKPDGMARLANATIEDQPVTASICANVLRPSEDAEKLEKAYASADVILDMSASVAVGRHLARDTAGSGRRVSLFLSPSARDLVVLAEDAERSAPLDSLEMQYYRAVATSHDLADHLPPPEGVRYGYSCRDRSAVLPQDLVSLHAGIGARALRNAIASAGAMASVWRAADDMSVTKTPISISPVVTASTNGWTVVADEHVMSRARELRAEQLPSETGGVLVGTHDMERQIVYVVDILGAPADSVKLPTHFIRGFKQLKQAVESYSCRTSSILGYVGEWHSHPDGVPPYRSPDDRTHFQWIAEHMAQDGLPPLMLILGRQWQWYVGEYD